MRHFRSIIGLTFISSFLLSGILLVSLGYLLFQTEKQSMEEGYATFETEHVSTQKELIRHEVQNVIAYIEYSKSLIEQRVRHDIQARVYEAHDIATHLYDRYKGTLSKPKLQALIREAIRPLRFNRGTGYYFITRLDGMEVLFADRPEMENTNILGMRDIKGKAVVREMIDIIRKDGEGFCSYYWSKPRHEGKGFKKIAFVKYFEPFDWFIGTGEYLDDTEAVIRQEVLDRIGKIRFGEDGYIFVLKTDGTFVSHINTDFVGKNYMQFKDPNGFPVIQELIDTATRQGGGFVQYLWEKPTLGKYARKISYSRDYKEWGWVIGAGIYLDDLEAALHEARDRLKKKTTEEFSLMGYLFALLLVVLLSISFFLSRRIGRGIETFTAFFDRAVTSQEKIDEGKLSFEEFKIIASRANIMVEDMARAKAELADLNQNLEHQVLERTAELEKANRELVQLDVTKSNFISMVSHELRTPLTSILGFTKLIARDVTRYIFPVAEADEKAKMKSQRIIKNLSIMEEEGVRLTRLVSDILDLSKIESGKMEWRSEEVRIDHCIGMAINSLSGQLDSKPAISLEQEIASGLPPIICDGDKLTQVIINLAGNAIKFMDRGTIRVTADREEDGGVRIQVVDDGPGIAPEDQAIIFDRFRQARKDKDMAKPGGTGLGLTISRQIVEHFGGRIWVESEPGRGSTFAFTLPRNGRPAAPRPA
ncbi:cache domain-containing protein [Pseudodesulfovibrio cashew]|nr:cache domain-containing protein [Pseudodesulfovibrio cashew]